MCLAIPAQIVEFCDPERFLARVDVAGVRRVVNVALVSGGPDGVELGDWVLDPRRLRHLAGRRAGGARDAPAARAAGTRVRAGARGAERERNRVNSPRDRANGCFTSSDIATAVRVLTLTKRMDSRCAEMAASVPAAGHRHWAETIASKTSTSSRASSIPMST